MAGPQPPDNGFNFFLSWGLLEWLITIAWGAGTGVALWVWNLGRRVEELKAEVLVLKHQNEELTEEIAANRRTVREIGNALDHKIHEENDEIKGDIERLRERLERTQAELPSRQFIESQNALMTQRIDRLLEAKLNPK